MRTARGGTPQELIGSGIGGQQWGFSQETSCEVYVEERDVAPCAVDGKVGNVAMLVRPVMHELRSSLAWLPGQAGIGIFSA